MENEELFINFNFSQNLSLFVRARDIYWRPSVAPLASCIRATSVPSWGQKICLRETTRNVIAPFQQNVSALLSKRQFQAGCRDARLKHAIAVPISSMRILSAAIKLSVFSFANSASMSLVLSQNFRDFSDVYRVLQNLLAVKLMFLNFRNKEANMCFVSHYFAHPENINEKQCFCSLHIEDQRDLLTRPVWFSFKFRFGMIKIFSNYDELILYSLSFWH